VSVKSRVIQHEIERIANRRVCATPDVDTHVRVRRGRSRLQHSVNRSLVQGVGRAIDDEQIELARLGPIKQNWQGLPDQFDIVAGEKAKS
jgi:hypothetical protein